MIFIGPVYRDAMYFRHYGSRVFLYSFDYLAPLALSNIDPRLRGLPHGWELQYLFGYPATAEGGWTPTADDTATTNQMSRFWTNFVIYGYRKMNSLFSTIFQ